MAEVLLADRFWRAAGGVVFDLATGEPIRWRESRARPLMGTPAAGAGTETPGAGASTLTPGAGAEIETTGTGAGTEATAAGGGCGAPPAGGLVDWGPLDAFTMFEAYRLERQPGSARPDAAGSFALCTPGAFRDERFSSARPRQASVPAAVFQIVDLLENGRAGEPRVLSFSGSERSLALSLAIVARESRLRGFVPVSAGVLSAPSMLPRQDAVLDALEGRHLLVIDWLAHRERRCARGDREAVARFVCRLGARSARPHLLLTVRPGGSGLLVTRFEHAALYRRWSNATGNRAGARAREVPVVYEIDPARFEPRRDGERGRIGATPAANLVVSYEDRIGERLNRAIGQAGRGRHAAAERGLREALGCTLRRDDRGGAASAAVLLGRLLLDRGRAAEARVEFEEARRWFDSIASTAGVVSAATLLGVALTDEARLTEAESVLRSAALAAVGVAARILENSARLALARCLFWRDRLDEAEREIDSVICPRDAPEAGPAHPAASLVSLPDASLLQSCYRARISLARRDVVAGTAAAKRAAERAGLLGDPVSAWAAHRAQAGVHASTGDTRALEEHATRGLAAARSAHSPVCAIRLRLVVLEGYRAAGRKREAAETARCLSRVRADRLPALLRRRVDAALSGSAKGKSAAMEPEWFDEVAALLAICRETEDERSLVDRLAADLRQRLRAAAVALVVSDAGARHDVASAGSAAALETVAGRAIDSGLALGPMPTACGIEMAVPVRHAGIPLGALACRWPVDRVPDGTRASMLLGTAAAAVAPAVRSLLDRRAHPQPSNGWEGDLIGSSEAMNTLRRQIAHAAAVPFPVLIEGESGSGKEVVARAIHRGGARRLRRFCAFNCAAITDDLIEAELFGYARGSFTGALADRVGLFEDADGGTLFLDEVSDLSPRAQAKLLRVIQEGEIRRVGENVTRAIDVRILAASNRPLAGEVAAGRFRRDLAYRLDVIRIQVPPLRERVEDVPALALHFWTAAAAKVSSRATLSPATLAALARYQWPGNVRELQNVIAALAATTPRRGSVAPSALPPALGAGSEKPDKPTLDAARRMVEQQLARTALARSGGRRSEAAASLGLTRQGFSKLLARLNLDAEAYCSVAEKSPEWPASATREKGPSDPVPSESVGPRPAPGAGGDSG